MPGSNGFYSYRHILRGIIWHLSSAYNRNLQIITQYSYMTKRFLLDTPCHLQIITQKDVNTNVESGHSNNKRNGLYGAGSL
jgi:hypothetical protein